MARGHAFVTCILAYLCGLLSPVLLVIGDLRSAVDHSTTFGAWSTHDCLRPENAGRFCQGLERDMSDQQLSGTTACDHRHHLPASPCKAQQQAGLFYSSCCCTKTLCACDLCQSACWPDTGLFCPEVTVKVACNTSIMTLPAAAVGQQHPKSSLSYDKLVVSFC